MLDDFRAQSGRLPATPGTKKRSRKSDLYSRSLPRTFGLRCRVRGCEKVTPTHRASGLCSMHARRKESRGDPEQGKVTLEEIRASGKPLYLLLKAAVKKTPKSRDNKELWAILQRRHDAYLKLFETIADGRGEDLSRNHYSKQAAERLAYAFRRVPPEKFLTHLLGVLSLEQQGRYRSKVAADFALFGVMLRLGKERRSSALHENPFPGTRSRWIPKPRQPFCGYNTRLHAGAWLREFVLPFASLAWRLDSLKREAVQTDTEALRTLFSPALDTMKARLAKAEAKLKAAQEVISEEATSRQQRQAGASPHPTPLLR